MRTQGTAAVVGGSMSGLFAALLLKRAGWDVTVFERNPTELAGRGAGIVTHAALESALARAGLSGKDGLGVAVESRRCYAPDGAVVGEIDFPQVNTSWDRLFQLLRRALPDAAYVLGAEVAGLDQNGDRPGLRFADGRSLEADLVVAADGFRSAVRKAVLPEVQPSYAGYVGWRGLAAEADFSESARETLFDCFAFGLPPGEQFVGYPVAGPNDDLREGHRRYNFVWYRPADESALARLLTDATGKRHDISIPPPLIIPDVIAETRDAAEGTLAPCLSEAVKLTDALYFQPIYDLMVPRMAFGRVALIGDAAFVARPHVGAGVTKAAEDAVALADSLANHGDIAAALDAFDAQRRPVGERIVTRARELGAYMQAQVRTEEERRAAERHRSPDAVMRETATLSFLVPTEGTT